MKHDVRVKARNKALPKKGTQTQGEPVVADEEAEDSVAGKIGIQSVEIGMRLLNALVEHALDNPPPMLKTLAAHAHMPPAKAHRYMVSLVRAGLAERDPTTDRYRLGATARHMGIRSLQGLDVVRLASNRLEAISAAIEQSVAVAIWTRLGPTIVALHDYRGAITISTRIGEVMPLTRSATGLVYAAWAPFKTRAMLQKEVAANRVVGISKLLDAVRSAGFGWTEGGMNATVNALSAPLLDFRGDLVGAITALGSADRFDVSRDGLIARTMLSHAHIISIELGYVGETWTAESRALQQGHQRSTA